MAILESPQQAYEDVEIRIFLDYEKNYVGEITTAEDRVSCKLDPPPVDELTAENDPCVYGMKLFSWLLHDDLLDRFRHSQWATETYRQSAGPTTRIRLRLWLDQQVADLRRLRWEAMRDPDRGDPICLDTAFSRFLRVNKPRGWPISERPLRMLVVVSNPSGLDEFSLPAIDLSLENSVIGSATDSLKSLLQCDRLSAAPTLSGIAEELKRGYHIVHLLANATRIDDRSCLMLSDDAGRAEAVPFEKVSEIVCCSSDKPPYLIFAATPVSAGHKVRSLFGIGPMLVEGGAQAAVTIPSPMDDEKLRIFIERFYNALIRTGTVDMAMTMARSSIYKTEEWQWAHPILYTRAPDAQLFQPLPELLETRIQAIVQGLRYE